MNHLKSILLFLFFGICFTILFSEKTTKLKLIELPKEMKAVYVISKTSYQNYLDFCSNPPEQVVFNYFQGKYAKQIYGIEIILVQKLQGNKNSKFLTNIEYYSFDKNYPDEKRFRRYMYHSQKKTLYNEEGFPEEFREYLERIECKDKWF